MPATSQDVADGRTLLYGEWSVHPRLASRNLPETGCTVWDDLRTAPRKHMVLSFQQHRRKIVGECRELDTARMSWNDLHPTDEAIQISFDFTVDLAELDGGEENAA